MIDAGPLYVIGMSHEYLNVFFVVFVPHLFLASRRDKEVIQRRKIEQEQDASKALNDSRKKCNYQGALVEVVGHRLRYTNKSSSYPEVFPTMKYVIVHENFEVYNEEKYAELTGKVYTTVDERIYRVCMEDLTTEKLPGKRIASHFNLSCPC